MKKDSIVDFLSYTALRVLGPAIRFLPLRLSLFLGKTIGALIYYFDAKHKARAYSNLKVALGNRLPPKQLKLLVKKFYQNLGMNFIEIFLLPKVDKAYLDKYVSMEGRDNIDEAFRKGKGVILLGVHAGSWELSNLVCANLGFPFSLFVRDQRFPRLDALLNKYRKQKGCKIIQRENQTRSLIQALKNNEAIGMTADQGGKNGELIKFFGKIASMPTGAVRLVLKYNSVILPAYYTRISGPYQKIIIGRPFEITKTGDDEFDIKENLQKLALLFEELIINYPEEYFWTYKIWKYSRERNILILSDNKAGHLRQSEAVANILKNCLRERQIKANIDVLEIGFKNNLSQHLLKFSASLAGKYNCQGCHWCLKNALRTDDYKSLESVKPDFVISAGSTLAAVNYLISGENLAKSINLMKPSVLRSAKFDLVIMPQHDRALKRKNIVITAGALNLIDDGYLKSQSEKLSQAEGLKSADTGVYYLGLLIGGDAKKFNLSEETISMVLPQVKKAAEEFSLDLLVTTSRRTPVEVEELIRSELKNYIRCKWLVIANDANPSYALGGILGLSKIVIVSPESISMISEAVSSKKYVIVFNMPGLSKKHKSFLEYLSRNNYIYLIEPEKLNETIGFVFKNAPKVNILNDNLIVAEAVKKLL